MFKFLERTATKYPNNVFLTREGTKYPKFIEMVKERATSLHAAGVKKGDTVGLLAGNYTEWLSTLFATWYLGGRVLLMDTNLTSFEYENMCKLVDCKMIVAEKKLMFDSKNIKFYDILKKDGKADPKVKPANVGTDDIATLSFTSGTTGNAKIVPLTHFNLMECASSLQDFEYVITEQDTIYGYLPLYHIFGFAVAVLATVNFGANILLQPVVDPKLILGDFQKFQPQIVPSVPRVLELFYAKIQDGLKEKGLLGKVVNFVLRRQKGLKMLGLGFIVRAFQKKILSQTLGLRARLIISGGAAMKPEIEAFWASLGLIFTQGYGLTETVGPICISHPRPGKMPNSFGTPMRNNECELRNVDSEGVGTLWVRGNNVFSGYLNNPETNKEVFDKDGWFNTGDLAAQHPNGEYYFKGRKKQMIVLDTGKNVYLDELEAMYIVLPGVQNVAVFEHEIRGKTVAYAVFHVADGVDIDSMKIHMAAANKQLASYKWVTHFAITTDELPLTSTKKVRHHVVREKLIAGEYPTRKE